MPALPAVLKVVRLNQRYLYAPNSRIFTHLYLSYTGALSVADALTWNATLFTKWGTAIGPIMGSGCSFVEQQMTDLTSTTGAQVTSTGSVVGSAAGSTLPAGVSAVLEIDVLRRYRGGHPRIYVPGPPVNATLDANNWTAAYIANLNTAGASLMTNMVTGAPAAVGSVAVVNVSYFTGFTNKLSSSGRSRPVPNLRGSPLIDVAISIDGTAKLASQRRRNQQSL